MFKKFIALIIIISIVSAFCACSKSASNVLEEVPPWIGTYVMENEETEEFKILTVNTATADDVVYEFKSVRSKDEFTGVLKTKSKKYAVCNAGDRCLKFDLKSSSTYIAVDDIWTSENVRNENWSGKYRRLEEGEELNEFGDSSWNGKYTCPDNNLTIEVYGIKEDLVLLSYQDPETGETLDFKCKISSESKRVAEYQDGLRTMKLELMRSNKSVVITETMIVDTLPNISGRYAA